MASNVSTRKKPEFAKQKRREGVSTVEVGTDDEDVVGVVAGSFALMQELQTKIPQIKKIKRKNEEFTFISIISF